MRDLYSDLFLSCPTDTDFDCNTNTDSEGITYVTRKRSVQLKERKLNVSTSLYNMSSTKIVKERNLNIWMVLFLK